MPSPLHSLILDRIRDAGPLTVAEFIDQALYHEQLGYYARAGQRSGRDGRFRHERRRRPGVRRTARRRSSPRCGRRLSAARRRPARAARPRSTWSKPAAGNGRLARDILDAAAARHPEFYRGRAAAPGRAQPAGPGRTGRRARAPPALASPPRRPDLPDRDRRHHLRQRAARRAAAAPRRDARATACARSTSTPTGDRLITREGAASSSPRLAEYLDARRRAAASPAGSPR